MRGPDGRVPYSLESGWLSREDEKLREELLAWCKNKPFLLNWAAIQLARSSEAVFETLEWARDGYPIAGVIGGHEDRRVWGYYEDYWSLLEDAIRSSDEPNAEEAIRWARRFANLPGIVQIACRWFLPLIPIEEHRRGYRIGKCFCRFETLRLIDEACSGRLKGYDERLADQFVRSPAGGFFLRVAAPCWFLTGAWPWELFARASRVDRPDLRALKTLIAFDSRVIHHPVLQPVLHCDDLRKRRSREALVGKALGKPFQAPNRRQVKNGLAGLIARISALLGRRLRPLELQELFDLVHRTPCVATGRRPRGALVDPDLPAGDAWRKSIQRYGQRWKLPPVPDKKFFDGVRTLQAVLSYNPQHEPERPNPDGERGGRRRPAA